MPMETKAVVPTLLVLTLAALPSFMGCSVLGIATTSDLETVQVEQRTQSRRTTGQLQSLEQEMARFDSLEVQMDQLESTTVRLRELESMTRGDLDSLMTEFRQATETLEAMGLSTMASDLAAARINSQRAVQNYLMRLKSEYEALGQEILELETMIQESSQDSVAVELDGIDASTGSADSESTGGF